VTVALVHTLPLFVEAFFCMFFFFFSSRRRHTRSKRDWSSDVCSSDLAERSEEFLGEPVLRLVQSFHPIPTVDREPEQDGTPVLGIGLSRDEPFAFEHVDHAGDRTKSATHPLHPGTVDRIGAIALLLLDLL